MLFLGLLLAGVGVGILGGILGIGGGTLLVPLLLTLGASPLQAVATSLVAVSLSAISGSIQNLRMGTLNLPVLLLLAAPATLTSYGGVWLARQISEAYLLFAFAGFLLVVLFLMQLQRGTKKSLISDEPLALSRPEQVGLLATGALAGCLSGLFGIGGGTIMVPLQTLLLKMPIKAAVVNSLAAIVPTALVATLGHAYNGDVLWLDGIALALGSLVGAQGGARLLPLLPEKAVQIMFSLLLIGLAVYVSIKGYGLLH